MEKKVKPISLIILVHQEAEVIESVIKEFYEKVTLKIPGSEFIVCEDGSTDGTKEILEKVKDKYRLTLHMGNEKKGYTMAMKEAFKLAKNDLVFFSDSDGQHGPGDFWDMVKLMEDNDMVIGWKKDRKDGPVRQVLTTGYNKIIGLYFGVRLHDIDCGFRLMNRKVIDFLLKQEWNLQFCISSELTVKASKGGLRIAEIVVKHFPREFGDSRGLPFKKIPKIVWRILKTFKKIKNDCKCIEKV